MSLYNKVEYELINRDNNTKITLINDIEGYDTSRRTKERSTDNFAIFTQYSRDISFIKEGADFLRTAFSIRNLQASVIFNEYRFNPKTDVRYLYDTAEVDFSEYKSDKVRVTVSFKSGGLNNLIKSKLRSKFELERLESINGNTIDELQTKTVSLASRDILLLSELETSEQDQTSEAFRMRFSDGNFRIGLNSIPAKINFSSDERIGGVIRDQFVTGPGDIGFLQASMFYYNNDVFKTLEIDVDLFFKLVFNDVRFSDLENLFLKAVLVRFTGGTTPVSDAINQANSLLAVNSIPSDQVDVLIDLGPVTVDINNRRYTYNNKKIIDLDAGESLGIYWYGGGNFGDLITRTRYNLDFQDISLKINVKELSKRANTNTKAVLIKDVGEKLMQIVTGEKNRYESDFYTNGDFKNTSIALGLWVRNFLDRKINTSLKDFVESTRAIHNTTFATYIVNGVEKLVHEPVNFFFPNEVVIKLGEVSNISESVAQEISYSEIKAGYSKPSGDNLYEEVQGLNTYNLTNSFTTPINVIDNEYDIQSPYRADAEGKELARRLQRENNPSRDSRYDKNIFVFDLIETETDVLRERIWSDDFETLPENIFSPETATGLRITPQRNLRRHGSLLGASLNNFQSDFIRYSDTRGNSELSTKQAGNDPIVENQDILISTLDRNRFTNMWVEFEYEIDFETSELLNGYTNVNGRLIPNCYFKVEYLNDGVKEYGYLFKVEIGGFKETSKWKLLKAF